MMVIVQSLHRMIRIDHIAYTSYSGKSLKTEATASIAFYPEESFAMKHRIPCCRSGSILSVTFAGAVWTSTVSGGAAMGADPSATITIEVNGSPVVVIVDEHRDESGGQYHFADNYADPDGMWTVRWNYWVDPDPLEGNAAIVGQTEVINDSDHETVFQVSFEVPLCPVIEGPSLLGAFVVVAIQMNENGGLMQDVNGQSVWAVTADGDDAHGVFHSPFLLGSTGKGSAALSAQFGAPFPSQPGPPVSEAAGLRHQFSLTDGDTAKITTSLFIGSQTDEFGECSGDEHLVGDLNQDGVVDVQDLLLLFQAWGPCEDCPADLNGDGWVDATDLLILLSNWS
jgi:hypothetical protein